MLIRKRASLLLFFSPFPTLKGLPKSIRVCSVMFNYAKLLKNVSINAFAVYLSCQFRFDQFFRIFSLQLFCLSTIFCCEA